MDWNEVWFDNNRSSKIQKKTLWDSHSHVPMWGDVMQKQMCKIRDSAHPSLKALVAQSTRNKLYSRVCRHRQCSKRRKGSSVNIYLSKERCRQTTGFQVCHYTADIVHWWLWGSDPLAWLVHGDTLQAQLVHFGLWFQVWKVPFSNPSQSRCQSFWYQKSWFKAVIWPMIGLCDIFLGCISHIRISHLKFCFNSFLPLTHEHPLWLRWGNL